MEQIVVDASKKRFRLNLKELYAYKDLFLVLAYRDYRIRYAQTYLGFIWAVIQPLTTLFIFFVVFGKAARIDTSPVPYPLFAVCGMCAWTYFSFVLSQSGNSIINNQAMIQKIYFPRLIIPLSKALVGLVDFGITFIFIIALLICSTSLFTFRLFHNPHDLAPLAESKITIAQFDNLKFDAANASAFLLVDSILKQNGFKKNDFIIPIVPLCGLIYLVHGRTPGMVIFSDYFHHLIKKNLENVDLKSRNTFIFMPQGYADKSFLEILDSYGLDSAHLEVVGNFEYKSQQINILKRSNV